MSWKLLLYIALLLVGMFMSKKNLFSEKIIDSIGKIQMVCLLLLLFAMGINLGMNDEILRSFATIGLKGIAFDLITIIFSVLFVHLLVRFALKKEVFHD